MRGNRTPVNTLCRARSPSLPTTFQHISGRKQSPGKPDCGGWGARPHQGLRPGTATHISPPSPSQGGFCDPTLLRTQAPPLALLRFFVFCILLLTLQVRRPRVRVRSETGRVVSDGVQLRPPTLSARLPASPHPGAGSGGDATRLVSQAPSRRRPGGRETTTWLFQSVTGRWAPSPELCFPRQADPQPGLWAPLTRPL